MQANVRIGKRICIHAPAWVYPTHLYRPPRSTVSLMARRERGDFIHQSFYVRIVHGNFFDHMWLWLWSRTLLCIRVCRHDRLRRSWSLNVLNVLHSYYCSGCCPSTTVTSPESPPVPLFFSDNFVVLFGKVLVLSRRFIGPQAVLM